MSTSAGYLYILSNPAMPGILKIGMSARGGLQRAGELYKRVTGVPSPFILEFEIYSTDARSAEYEAHESLKHLRISESREFFRVPLNVAVKVVCSVVFREYEDLDISDASNYFDPCDAAMIAYQTRLSWSEIVDAFKAMRADEIREFYKRHLESRFNACCHIYGEQNDLTRLAENKLTDFVERFDADSME